jgi:hypothetical protein
MTVNRRNFIRYSAAGAMALLGNGALGTPARRKSVALPLDSKSFCVDLAPLVGAGTSITDYSGFSFCPAVDALLLFGGGHAATPEDVVLRFPVATQAWSADYAATPKATMLEANADGTYKNLNAGKFWNVQGETPPLRPVSRHTYSGFIWSSAINRMLLPMANNGTYYGFSNETTGGNIAEYDPVNRTWEDAGVIGCGAAQAYCEDPVSGLLLAHSQGTFRVYDPRKRQWVVNLALNAIPYFGYAANLVYYPPNDKFYYIGRDVDPTVRRVHVWEYAFDRTALRPTYAVPNGRDRGQPMTTNWRPSPKLPGKETAYAYDSTNQLIVGSLYGEVMLGFRPNADGTGTWLQHPAPGTTQQTFYCMDYVPRINTHFFVCEIKGEGKTTFGFRWDPAQATSPVDPYTTLPHATITPPAATLQAACANGGTIAMSAGFLYESEANAHPTKPVNIVGQETTLWSVGFESKGIIVTGVDTRLESVTLTGAAVADGNGAGIRHEGGNLVLERVVLRDCQNGILGPSKDTPASVVMNDCDVFSNGTGTGQTHGVYIGKIARFVCTNSRFRDTRIGHHVKTRAHISDIEACEVGLDFVGNESYNIDIPVGGDASVSGCVLRQGPNTDNPIMLNYGSEPNPYPGGSLKVESCRFESTAGGVGIRNALANVVADVRNCAFVGVTTPVVGAHVRTNCTLDGRPLPDSGSVVIEGPGSGFDFAPETPDDNPGTIITPDR